MQIGWVKLHRQLLDSRVFANEGLLKVWLYCLCRANHKINYVPITTGIGNSDVKVVPGEFVFGRKSAARDLKMKESTVYKRMKKLESMGNINMQSNTHFSIVSICNWEIYQSIDEDKEQAKEQPSNNQVTGREQPSNTDKNDKNDKNSLFPSDSGRDTSNDFHKRKLNSITEDEIKADKDSTIDEKVDYITWKFHQLLSDTFGDYKNHKNATLDNWRDPIRLLHTQDKISLNEIWKLAKFAHIDDEFWRYTVQSSTGLRNNIDQIRANFDRDKKSSGKLLTHTEMINDMEKRGLKTTDGNYVAVEQGEGKKPKWRYTGG